MPIGNMGHDNSYVDNPSQFVLNPGFELWHTYFDSVGTGEVLVTGRTLRLNASFDLKKNVIC